MKTMFYVIMLSLAFLNAIPAKAQTRTYYKDLSDRAHVPLYDCEIYSSSRDRNKCMDLKRGESVRWENDGYAVSCYDLSRARRDSCLNLAEDLTFNVHRMIDCSSIRDRESQRQCEITKLAYFEGRFHDRGSDRVTRPPQTTTTTTTIISNGPGYSTRTTCDMNAYDRAVDRWRIKKEEQRKKGQTKTAVGVVATIGGIILSGSGNRTTSTIGQGLAIGGVLLTTWGLVEMIDADISYPHLDPYCQTDWIKETRMVVVERQECVTTRYSERNRYSSRYYYEVNCSNKRYVTFEEFSPWDRGSVVTYRY